MRKHQLITIPNITLSRKSSRSLLKRSTHLPRRKAKKLQLMTR
jgi:hypothetical protein